MEMLYAKETQASKVEVVRLPCIGPTLTDYEGYVTSFNSILSIIYEVGNGFLDSLQGIANNIIDLLPADFVVNYMITISAILPSPLVSNNDNEFTIRQESDLEEDKMEASNISIHNLSTSSRNPISFAKFAQYVVEAWA